MPEMIIGSDKLIPEIEGTCIEFLKYIKSIPGSTKLGLSKGCIGTAKKPGIIISEYKRAIKIYQNNIFSKDSNGERKIDYYLIAALYIRSFLKHRPFSLDVGNESRNTRTCPYTEFPNEYFIIFFLEFIFRKIKKDDDSELKMEQTYKENFINLLSRYNKKNLFDPLIFSKKIVQIEKDYFKCVI